MKVLGQVARRLMKKLPVRPRDALYRRLVKVPPLAASARFSMELATSREDLEAAYGLLHDCYGKLLHPHPSGLKCNRFTFLPSTTSLVAKFDGRVVGTVSLMRDGELGLPSDEVFRAENDAMRRQGKRLVEVSCLGVDSGFRDTGHAVSLLLMKYLYTFICRSLDCTTMVCSVVDGVDEFYRALWLFTRHGAAVRHPHYRDIDAVHLSLDVGAGARERILAAYAGAGPERNLAAFALAPDERFHYPAANGGQVEFPVFTPELLRYFLRERTRLWDELDAADWQRLRSAYEPWYPEVKDALPLPTPAPFPARDYRVATNIAAQVSSASGTFRATIADLTPQGCFLRTGSTLGPPQEAVEVCFVEGGEQVRVPATIRWESRGESARHPHGYGVRFVGRDARVQRLLGAWFGAPAAGRAASRPVSAVRSGCASRLTPSGSYRSLSRLSPSPEVTPWH